jgi:hypothetical protein
VIAKHLPSFVEYPPMQAGASFSVGDLKEKVERAMKAAADTINRQRKSNQSRRPYLGRP